MILRAACAVALLGAAGWLHGRWTDRWGAPSEFGATAEQLTALPLSLEEWDGRDVPVREEVAFQLTAAPTLMRQYTNRSSGTSVGFFVTYGRTQGMIYEHTPRVCYAEWGGYTEVGAGERVNLPPSEGAAGAEFLVHTFVKTTPAYTHRVRVFWAYGDRGAWSAPADPRLSFPGRQLLYKVYVTRDLVSEDEPVADDPALPFIRALLPGLGRAAWPAAGP